MPRQHLIWVAAVVLSGLLIATAVGIDQKEAQSKLAQHQLYLSQSLSTSSWQIRNHIDRAVDDLMVFSQISDFRRLRMPETQAHLLEHFPAARSRGLDGWIRCLLIHPDPLVLPFWPWDVDH